MRVVNALIVLICLCKPSYAEYELGAHPRIFLTPGRVSELASLIGRPGMAADDYALVKAEADRVLELGELRNLNSQWHLQTDMFCAAMVYLIERELGNPDAEQYARVIVDIWGDGLVLTNLGAGQFGSFAIAYDWIFDAMTEQERVDFGLYIGSWLRYYTSTAEIVLRNGGWLYNKTWGPEHLSPPNSRDAIAPKLLVAIALAGAGTVQEADCIKFLDSWEKRIPADCIPWFDTAGGVWPESMGHGSYGPVKVIPWAFEAWRTATGQDFFQLGSANSYLKEMNRWGVHLSVPFSGKTAYIDDNTGPAVLPTTWQWTAPILGARYFDPVANWVADNLDTSHWYRVPWLRLASYDHSLYPANPGDEGWPAARLFSGAGHVYMRGRWNDPSTSWAFFGAGPNLANHARDDEGHFMIAKNGWLVLRAGGSGHNDDDYYAGGSMPFNIVTVFDPAETFRRLSPGEDVLAAGGTSNERDGGLIRHVYEGDHDEVVKRGTITAYKHGSRYTYAAADLSRGYRILKVNEVTRQFIYFRGSREYFVVFDRVEAKNGEHPKHWFLHVPTEPVVSGEETVEVEGHLFTSTAPRWVSWLSDPAGDEFIGESTLRSRAFMTTVLPSSAELTRRGGEGHDFWGHPEEPTAQYNHVGKKTGDPPYAPWRLEVRAPGANKRDYFLHVIEIAEPSDTAPSPVELLQPDSTLAGVAIGEAGPLLVEVLFNAVGGLGAQVRFGGEGEFELLPGVVDTTVVLIGDFNADSRLGIADVLMMMLLARRDQTDARVDFNGDGVWSIDDAVALLNLIRDNRGYLLLAGAAREELGAVVGERERNWLAGQLAGLGMSAQERRLALELIGAGAGAGGRRFFLGQNSPNPLNPSTTITYGLPEDEFLRVRMVIYNLRGQVLRTLVDTEQSGGVKRVFWDGTDMEGHPVPSGVYFYRLTAGKRTTVRKMVVLR
ncbi:MAG: T9SS type A sorting domain-containing protein [Candidatus Glassbacteria bacterium]|nr:T9SS type A sorting domain-containing protein [Candidatus Glassbacteria bacterium]